MCRVQGPKAVWNPWAIWAHECRPWAIWGSWRPKADNLKSEGRINGAEAKEFEMGPDDMECAMNELIFKLD